MTRLPSFAAFHNKANWIIALASEAIAPGLRWYARRRCREGAADPRLWRKVLIVGDTHIGDILYRTGSLEALKAGLPECDLYYLAAEDTACLLEGNPALRAVLPWASPKSFAAMEPSRIGELRAMGFDALLSTNAIRYWPELLFAIRLGIPNRVGYTHKGFSGWVTHPMPNVYPQSFPLYFRSYVGALTGQAPVWPVRPRLYPTAVDQDLAGKALKTLELDSRRPVIACFMTTRQRLRGLPESLMGESMLKIHVRTGAQILLMGSKDDAGILGQVNARYGLDARVMAGILPIRALSVFLGHCDAVVTSDSGPRHLANAAEIPVFFFRNLWFSSVEAGCYVESETDLCPAGVERVGEKRQRLVLQELSPDDVADRVIGGMRKRSGSS